MGQFRFKKGVHTIIIILQVIFLHEILVPVNQSIIHLLNVCALI